MSETRNAALEEAAIIADRWAAENRIACNKARARSSLPTDSGMADMLNGAAIECHAIAAEIRAQKSL